MPMMRGAVMAEYKVKFEVFEGPMDLLLYLVKREEVDIYEVNLTKIAREFIEYVDLMREFDKMCYKECAGSSRGNVLFEATIGCFPEMNGSFPRSNRCLKGWAKVRPAGERGPLPLEAAWVERPDCWKLHVHLHSKPHVTWHFKIARQI